MAKKKATKAKILPLPALLTDFEVTCGNRPFAQITAKFINAARKAVSFKITRTELSLATLLQKKPGKITIKEKNSSFLPISTIRDFPNADTLAELKELTASINGDKIAVFPLAKETTIVEVKDGKASRYDFQDYTVSSFKIYRYTIKTKNKTVSKVVFCTYQKRKALCRSSANTDLEPSRGTRRPGGAVQGTVLLQRRGDVEGVPGATSETGDCFGGLRDLRVSCTGGSRRRRGHACSP